MKKKQIIGIAVAAIAFIIVCSVGMIMQNWKQKTLVEIEQSFDPAFISALENENVYPEDESYIGILRIEGTIQSGADDGAFLSYNTYNHQAILAAIDEMSQSYTNEGILLFINSGGGTVYESDEVYLKLLEYKNITGRPVWAYLGATACSGAYYIACASDHIIANRNTMTGSIGVLSQMRNLQGLYEKLGIEEINITSGDNKAMGSSGSKLTDEQRSILQSMIDECYEQFVGIVAEGRNMSTSDVKALADGRIYTARQALSNGLVDEVLTFDEAMDSMLSENDLEYVDFYEPYEEPVGFLSMLFSAYTDNMTRNYDSQSLSEYLNKNGGGELWYYAG